MTQVVRVLLYIAAGIGVVVLVGVGVLAVLARVVKAPSTLGVRDGKLSACPNSPNCVSTMAQDERHRIEPMPFACSRAAARERLLDIVRSMEGTRIISAEPTYIYVEFRIKGMGYVDDVEFILDEESGVVHFRSASRLPYWDWGVNRARMESIRGAFQAQGA